MVINFKRRSRLVALGVAAAVAVMAICFVLISARRSGYARSVSANAQDSVTVIVDAGHGGMDGGATAQDGTVEKDINLSIALKLRDMLDTAGYNVIMTRETDDDISDSSAKSVRLQKVLDIKNRMNIIEQTPDALFVSIHQNHYGGPSYSGAQVLHEMTIFPVREKNIPLNIRNTNEPDHPGTLITESFVEAPNPERFVTGIAGKCDFSIVTVSKKGLSGAVGTLRAILEVFENNSIPVAHTPSGIDCISLAMPTEALTPNQYSLLDELRSEIRPDSIQINDHIAVIAVVGRKMAFRVGTSGKIFAALGKAGINIRMISQGPDEQAIILGVDNKDYADAIRVLYNAFVK